MQLVRFVRKMKKSEDTMFVFITDPMTPMPVWRFIRQVKAFATHEV